MALIDDLRFRTGVSVKVTKDQPSNDRLVVVQCVIDGKAETIGARYRNNRWIGEATGSDLTDELPSHAVWFESLIYDPSVGPTHGEKNG